MIVVIVVVGLLLNWSSLGWAGQVLWQLQCVQVATYGYVNSAIVQRKLRETR